MSALDAAAEGIGLSSLHELVASIEATDAVDNGKV
jgi:hypothetical protein